ncbi:uncharacterized protein LOC100678794 [Nasonia vitripennis]|uniref:Uncharacterized protein n=1 Tax=Nasonia vitripennis TaxID=7425 RepID=A0A7M7GF36_NASVI|nr:uncharacterized protein LOC100678794 [Nasonia vitripennis]
MSTTSSQWFSKRINGYTEELGKSFTEAKARVQRGLEQLKLKNAETLKRIPSFRGSFRGSFRASSKKTKSAKKAKSPMKKSEHDRSSSAASASRSEVNATYRISRKAYYPSTFIDRSSSSSSASEQDDRLNNVSAERTLLPSTLRRLPLKPSHSFPRISRSRKIENINIVFASPFPSAIHRPRNQTSTPKEQLTTQDKARKDAFDMEKLCSLMAEIHAKMRRPYPTRKPPRNIRRYRKDTKLVPSPASSLERHTSSEEDSCSDSELAISTDISLKFGDSEDDEPRIDRADSELDDPDVYWIPKKIVNLPRTSSRLSMMSRSSYSRASPELSPIEKSENKLQTHQERESQLKRAWGMTYRLSKGKAVAKQLFSIDEAHVLDSGYSDRSGANSRAASSRATMYELQNNGWRLTSSPTISSSPSPTPAVSVPAYSQRFAPTHGPYVLKSFYV